MDYFLGIANYIFNLLYQFFQLMLSNWMTVMVVVFCVFNVVIDLFLIIRGRKM